MGFGEPWRVIHSLPCTNSPVIHPQARHTPTFCPPCSACLTFLLLGVCNISNCIKVYAIGVKTSNEVDLIFEVV